MIYLYFFPATIAIWCLYELISRPFESFKVRWLPIGTTSKVLTLESIEMLLQEDLRGVFLAACGVVYLPSMLYLFMQVGDVGIVICALYAVSHAGLAVRLEYSHFNAIALTSGLVSNGFIVLLIAGVISYLF